MDQFRSFLIGAVGQFVIKFCHDTVPFANELDCGIVNWHLVIAIKGGVFIIAKTCNRKKKKLVVFDEAALLCRVIAQCVDQFIHVVMDTT